MKCQLCKHHIFLTLGCPYLYPPRMAAEPRTRTEQQKRGEDTVNDQGDAEKRSTTTTRPGLPHGGPRGVEPTEQSQSSGEKGQPRATQREAEDEHTRRSPMTPAVTNSRTVTPFRPVPPTEKQVTTLAATPPATHIRTVPKPPSTKRTM